MTTYDDGKNTRISRPASHDDGKGGRGDFRKFRLEFAGHPEGLTALIFSRQKRWVDFGMTALLVQGLTSAFNSALGISFAHSDYFVK